MNHRMKMANFARAFVRPRNLAPNETRLKRRVPNGYGNLRSRSQVAS